MGWGWGGGLMFSLSFSFGSEKHAEGPWVGPRAKGREIFPLL